MNILTNKDSATETIKGFVVIKKDGKIVRANHNLIVKTGRQFVHDKIKNVGFVSGPSNTYSNYKFYKIYAESSTGASIITTSDMALSDISGRISEGNEFEINNTSDTLIGSNNDAMYESFTVTLNGDDSDTIGGIFITIKDYQSNTWTTSSEEVLFSRAVFDPLKLSPDSEYTLTYYIYF